MQLNICNDPQNCWLHWSRRVERTEAENRVQMAMGTKETILRKTDLGDSPQLYLGVNQTYRIGDPGDKP